MWFGEPHPFPERGSPIRLSVSEEQRYKGRTCRNCTTTLHSINKALSFQASNGSSRPIVRRLVSLTFAKLNPAAFRLCVFTIAKDILNLMILYDLFPLPCFMLKPYTGGQPQANGGSGCAADYRCYIFKRRASAENEQVGLAWDVIRMNKAYVEG